MSFEIEGKIHKVFDTESKTDTFQTRDLVIQTEGVYPQFVKFQFTQDRCALADGYNESDKVKVYFDLRGREWNGKYFTNLNAWKIERVQAEEVQPATSPGEIPAAMPVSDFPTQEPPKADKEFDDLPF